MLTNKRPLLEAISSIFSLGMYVCVIALGCRGDASTRRVLLFGWVLPGRLAVIALAYAFDYLPHRPERTLRSENEYTATNVTALFGECTQLLTWPLLHQNYHNIHHLAPYVPFYYYSTIWHATKEELIRNGTEIKPVFGYTSATKSK
jgi:beta-carotene hydroxylase